MIFLDKQHKMSFQNLLEGDCGGQNPLIKIGSHFTQDQSFRQERVHPLSPDISQAELVGVLFILILLRILCNILCIICIWSYPF